MTAPIKNVAVVGASGNLGVPLVKELIAAGFKVTALTRESSSSTFPSEVTVKKVDLDSVESLTSALRSQDAVVSTIASSSIGGQYSLIDGAVAARVKRFLPSEFGLHTPRTAGTPGIGQLLGAKAKVLDHLAVKSRENSWFSWTGIATGLFFDWGLTEGRLFDNFDKATKTATLYDSGNEHFQASNLLFIARAVVAVLSRPEQTENKYLSVASFNISHNEMLAAIQEETGERWAVKHLNSVEVEKKGVEALGKGDVAKAFLPLLARHLYGDGQGQALKPEESANALLGLQEEDPKVVIKAWLSN
ncbi:hypothetical protein BJ170DRAFT_216289 [Xylariales sp. AK1849]|nr:hypothetical protein BJ170DRAFT_216289 [Xylariales sp. AK1849]